MSLRTRGILSVNLKGFYWTTEGLTALMGHSGLQKCLGEPWESSKRFGRDWVGLRGYLKASVPMGNGVPNITVNFRELLGKIP